VLPRNQHRRCASGAHEPLYFGGGVEWVRASIVRHEISGAASAPLQLMLQKPKTLRGLLRVAELEHKREGP